MDDDLYIDPRIQGQTRHGVFTGRHLREAYGLVDDGSGDLIPAAEAEDQP